MRNYLFFIVVMFVSPFSQASAGTLIIQYGFEDWTGNPNTTPGYIYSSSSSTYWSNHANSNSVVASNNSNCGNRTAHTGNYYIHRQFVDASQANIVDPCLGRVAESINDHGNIGLGGTLPLGSSEKTRLSSAITENTITVRLWFRTTGDWKNQTLGYAKFFRLYGTGADGRLGAAFVHMTAGGTDTGFRIYDPSGTDWSSIWGEQFRAGRDLQDGNWHAFAVSVTRNNDTSSPGNLTTRVWFDDWDMSGEPLGERTITDTRFGSGFYYLQMTQNWSASYPSSLMGIDFDDIEVWNGLPETVPTPTPTPTPAPTPTPDTEPPSAPENLRYQ